MGFDFNAYRIEAERTSQYAQVIYYGGPVQASGAPRAMQACLGLLGELGEFADLIKKWVFHGHLSDDDLLQKELGDMLWYQAELMSCLNIPQFLSLPPQIQLDQLGTFETMQAFADPGIEAPRISLCSHVYDQSVQEVFIEITNMSSMTTGIMQHIALALLESNKGPVRAAVHYLSYLHVIWSRLVSRLGYDTESIALKNLSKLRARYPQGFSTERSMAPRLDN